MFSALTEVYMTEGIQRFTKRYVNVLGVLIGLTVVSSILFYSGCGMTGSPSIRTNPTPTPDTTPPTSTITSLTAGATVQTGKPVTITGTASDAGGGSVVRVEVSVDGGANYSAATGTTAWSFNWTPNSPGQATIKSRAVDNRAKEQRAATESRVIVDAPTTSTITIPTDWAAITGVPPIAITGTASDNNGGSVVKVEVSVDGGAKYSAATGTTAWSFNWTPSALGPATIKSRAVDNTGNVQNPPDEIHVTKAPATFRVPSDRPTIQSAINDAIDGETALVAPGTYPEHIDFKGKAITVTSEGEPRDTIIDAGNADSVVFFISGEGRGSTLNGFTLKNGKPPSTRSSEGGGILIQGSSPTITNNVITNNHACSGVGIAIRFGSPLIQLNTITGNINDVCQIGGIGGGIYITGEGSAEILDNVISNNASAAGGGIGILGLNTTPIIKRNVIKGNGVPAPGQSSSGDGGGIYMSGEVNALIVQNLITGNQASRGGGIYWLIGKSILVNNTIADNDATFMGSGILADGARSGIQLTNNIIIAKPGQFALSCGNFVQEPPTIRFNNIFSVDGLAYGGTCSDRTGMEGNISPDPEVIAPTQGDYHLQLFSPSIDTGDNTAPNLPDTDLDGDPRILEGDGNETATIDMGVDEVLLPPGLTWPISTITSPKAGATVATGTTVRITGLARDAGGGTVDRVEVSVDGGATWNLATGTTAWSYDWTPATPGPATIKSRAVDDSGNVQGPPAEITVTVRTAVTIRVTPDQTIQSAIDAADYHDTVLVAPGTYHENINFRGKAITVKSESGLPEDTIIDGGNADSVVVFTSGERRDSVLNGF